MLRKIGSSFSLAWTNIRSNFFHTFLSVLGVIIGVGALVSILSLIDGMEEFARDQIATTTSLNAIVIRPELYRQVNGVKIRKDSVSVLDYHQCLRLQRALTKPVKTFMRAITAGEVSVGTSKQVVGVNIFATGPALARGLVAETGALFEEKDIELQLPKAIVNKLFLKAVKINNAKEALGQSIIFKDNVLTIVGVVADEKYNSPVVCFPITLLSKAELSENPPELMLEAQHTEDIPALKEEIAAWIKHQFTQSADDFNIITNEFRVAQTAKGFLLFRVIMGLIVGISVVVGGIGVMNVLLISVTERTAEIGIRKAVGANRRDIILLFLSESITVSAFGSLMGLIFGIVSTMIIIPIVKAITKVPFQAAYTLNTLLVITIIALLVGIIFGTYPAMRASRLNPVDAIRHE